MNELMRNLSNLVTPIEQIEQRPPPYHADDADADGDAHNRHQYNFNCYGMGDNNHGNNGSFAKFKFSLPSFAGNIDPEAYLD